MSAFTPLTPFSMIDLIAEPILFTTLPTHSQAPTSVSFTSLLSLVIVISFTNTSVLNEIYFILERPTHPYIPCEKAFDSAPYLRNINFISNNAGMSGCKHPDFIPYQYEIMIQHDL